MKVSLRFAKRCRSCRCDQDLGSEPERDGGGPVEVAWLDDISGWWWQQVSSLTTPVLSPCQPSNIQVRLSQLTTWQSILFHSSLPAEGREGGISFSPDFWTPPTFLDSSEISKGHKKALKHPRKKGRKEDDRFLD